MDGSIKTRSCSFLAIVIGFNKTSGVFPDSISGTLCLSATSDAKSHNDIAAVKDDRTHVRYGRKDED